MIKFKNACFEFYTDTVLRVRYSPSAKFHDFPPFICSEKLPKTIKCNIKETRNSIAVSTKAITVNYSSDGLGFNKNNLSISFKWGGLSGESTPPFNDDKNLGGTCLSLDERINDPILDRNEEKGILSKNGFYVLENKNRVYWNSQKRWYEVIKEDDSIDFFFFAYGKDYQNALKDFVYVFGKIPIPPKWIFGFWYSRWYPYKDKEFIDIIKKYRSFDIPIDVMVIDTDWREKIWNGYDWNKKYFPDHKKTMKEIHETGCKIVLNDHPGYYKTDPLPYRDSHIKALKRIFKEPTLKGEWGCDWSKNSVVEAFNKICLGPFVKEGIDLWWIDGWVESPFDGANSQLLLNRNYFKLREKITNKRGVILSRWGGIGAHRYPVQFSGDTYSDWATLKKEIYFTAASGNIGAIYWSHDIGGFHSRDIAEELFIRWVQFGALSPIFRTHSNHGIREPWNFSEKALEIFKLYTKLRYALLPYFYTLAKNAYDKGLPIVRPLYLHYPEEDGAYRNDYEYLLGKDLLIIPADGAIPEDKKTFSKNAYFPGDKFVDIYNGEIISGIHCRGLEIPLEILPIFVRVNAIIPYYEEMKYTIEKKKPLIYFDIFPETESNFELYEDDGETLKYQQGNFNLIKMSVIKSKNSIQIKINNKEKNRDYNINVMLYEKETVKKVLFDKKEISYKIINKCAAGLINSKIKFCNIFIKAESQTVNIEIIFSHQFFL